MTPERVDAQGMANVAAAAAKYLPRTQRSVEDVLSMRSTSDIAKWQRYVRREQRAASWVPWHGGRCW